MRLNKKSFGSAVLIAIIALITIVTLSDVTFLFRGTGDEYQGDSNKNSSAVKETIFLTTQDNKKIAADYFEAESPIGWVVYVHSMPKIKESFQSLVLSMGASGYSGLALDLRGHGSSQGGPDGYLNFSDSEHQASILDIKSAVEFLKERGAKDENISFVGASIGANLSLKYFVEGGNFPKLVLLSPGINYRGINAREMATKIIAGRKVLLMSSLDDAYNSQEVEEIYSLIPKGVIKEKKIYDQGGHGTDMLINQPGAQKLVEDFIKT